MSDKIAEFPFSPVQFDRHGQPYDVNETKALVKMIKEEEITDLIVIAHGWNNNISEASELYTELLTNMRTLIGRGVASKVNWGKVGVLGVYWPSKKWTAEELQPGGGASVGGRAEMDTLLAEELDNIAEFSAHTKAAELAIEAKALLPRLDVAAAADNFVAIVLELLEEPEAEETEGLPDEVTTLPGHELLDRLANVDLEEDEVGYEGGGAGLIDSMKQGTQRFLNLVTYFKMKKRAGTVGENGMITVLRSVKQHVPTTRLHLVGHSFGGRLVTAACSSLGSHGLHIVDTLTLLQAAFSHNGFAENYWKKKDGYFRPAVTKGGVRAKISITHTHHDSANKTAYTLASRMHREDGAGGAGLGDADDRFGAIGANGALTKFTPEATASIMPLAGKACVFKSSLISNFEASDYVKDHGDVRNLNVANVVMHTIAEGI